jgi:hypothetical protein
MRHSGGGDLPRLERTSLLRLIRKETRGLNPAGSSLNFLERTFSVALFGKLSFNGQRACS